MKRRAQKANVREQPVKKKRKTQHVKSPSKRKTKAKDQFPSSEEELKWLQEQIDEEEEDCNRWEKRALEENKKYLESKEENMDVKEEELDHPIFKECENLEDIKKKTEKMLKRMEGKIRTLMEGTSAEEILTLNRDRKEAKQAAIAWIDKGGSDFETDEEAIDDLEDDEDEGFHEVAIKEEPVVKPTKSKPKPKPAKPKTTKPKIIKIKPKSTKIKLKKPRKKLKKPEKKKKDRKVSFGSGPNPIVKVHTYEAVVYEEPKKEQLPIVEDEIVDSDEEMMPMVGPVDDDFLSDEEPVPPPPKLMPPKSKPLQIQLPKPKQIEQEQLPPPIIPKSPDLQSRIPKSPELEPSKAVEVIPPESMPQQIDLLKSQTPDIQLSEPKTSELLSETPPQEPPKPKPNTLFDELMKEPEPVTPAKPEATIAEPMEIEPSTELKEHDTAMEIEPEPTPAPPSPPLRGATPGPPPMRERTPAPPSPSTSPLREATPAPPLPLPAREATPAPVIIPNLLRSDEDDEKQAEEDLVVEPPEKVAEESKPVVADPPPVESMSEEPPTPIEPTPVEPAPVEKSAESKEPSIQEEKPESTIQEEKPEPPVQKEKSPEPPHIAPQIPLEKPEEVAEEVLEKSEPPPKKAQEGSEPTPQKVLEKLDVPPENMQKKAATPPPPKVVEAPLEPKVTEPESVTTLVADVMDTEDEIIDDDTDTDPLVIEEKAPEIKEAPVPVEITEDSILESDSDNSFLATTSDSRDSDSDVTPEKPKADESFVSSPLKDDTPQSPPDAKAKEREGDGEIDLGGDGEIDLGGDGEIDLGGDGEIDLGFGMEEDEQEDKCAPTIQPTSPETDAMEIEIQEKEALSPIQPLPASGHDTSLNSDFIDDDDDLEPITVDLSPLMDPMEDDAGMQIEAVTLEPIEFDLDDEYGNFENEALSPIMTSLDVEDDEIPEPPKFDLDDENLLEYACKTNKQSKQVLLAKTMFASLPMKLLTMKESEVTENFLKPAMFLMQYRKFNPYQWYVIYTKTLQFVHEFTFMQARTFIAALSKVSDAIAECVKELKTRFDRNLPNHIYKKSLLCNLHHVISLSLSTGYVMKPTIDGELLDFMKGDKLEKKHKINFTRFLCAWIQVMDKYDEFEEFLRIILTRFNITTRVMLLTEIKDCLPEMAEQVGFFEHHAELMGTILGYWEHLQQEDAMKIRKIKTDLRCDLGHNKIIDRDYVLQMVENQLIQINNSASQLNNLKWMESDALLRSLNQLTYDVQLICLSCHGWVSHHAFLAVWRHLKGIHRPKPQFFFLRLIAFIYRGILDRQHYAEIQNPHTSIEINFYKEYPGAFLRIGKATPNKELASCLYCCLFVMREKNLAYELKEFKDLDDRKIMKFIRFFPAHESKIKGSLGFGKLDQSI